MWELDCEESWALKNWCFWPVVRKLLRVPWTATRSNRSILKKISPDIHWKDWCWSWNSNTLATWYKELTHLKRPRCWERLKAGREGDNRGWDGWMASLTQWTWVWVNSRSWWQTGRPGVLQSMGSQRVGHNWWLNWIELRVYCKRGVLYFIILYYIRFYTLFWGMSIIMKYNLLIYVYGWKMLPALPVKNQTQLSNWHTGISKHRML